MTKMTNRRRANAAVKQVLLDFDWASYGLTEVTASKSDAWATTLAITIVDAVRPLLRAGFKQPPRATDDMRPESMLRRVDFDVSSLPFSTMGPSLPGDPGYVKAEHGRPVAPCFECIGRNRKMPEVWCQCADGETCHGPCRNRAHEERKHMLYTYFDEDGWCFSCNDCPQHARELFGAIGWGFETQDAAARKAISHFYMHHFSL